MKKSADENYKRKTDALPQDQRDTVVSFYSRRDISSSLPDARSAKKNKDGEVEACRVMNMALSRAYQLFCAAYPAITISLTKFKLLRPSNVLTQANHKRRNCLCGYCVNVEFKLQAIANVKRVHGLDVTTFPDTYSISRKTLCEKEDGSEYKRACLMRNCQECGVDLEDLQKLQEMEEKTSWLRWEKDTSVYNGRKVHRVVKKRKSGMIKEMIDELKKELEPFSLHLFNAQWQWHQYNLISSGMPEGRVVCCMNFAENYDIRSQDEEQSAHWSNIQATIHPVVASYHCPEPDCSEIVTDTMMMISDDQKHCPHAVQHFNKTAINHLQNKGITINKLIHYSDWGTNAVQKQN